MDRTQNSNLRPQTGQKVVQEDRRSAMRAHDRLPPSLRQALNDTEEKFSAAVLYGIYRRRGEEIAMRSLQTTQQRLTAGYEDWLRAEAASLQRASENASPS